MNRDAKKNRIERARGKEQNVTVSKQKLKINSRFLNDRTCQRRFCETTTAFTVEHDSKYRPLHRTDCLRRMPRGIDRPRTQLPIKD